MMSATHVSGLLLKIVIYVWNAGTFTLSNLGMFGVDRFDAILPPGQVYERNLNCLFYD